MRPTPVVRWVCLVLCHLPPVVRIARSIRCAVLGTTTTCRLHLAFNGCNSHHMLSCLAIVWLWCGDHHLHPLFASRARWVLGNPSAYHSRLAFDRRVLGQPLPPPIVHVSRPMGVCCDYHLHPSFASHCNGCMLSPHRLHLAFDGL